jgi:hypothetical protein
MAAIPINHAAGSPTAHVGKVSSHLGQSGQQFQNLIKFFIVDGI